MTDKTPNAQLPNPQDPLPEANWLWRRVYVCAVTAACLWMLWGLVDRVGTVAVMRPTTGIAALIVITKWVIGLLGVVITYYLLAPSAEQITKMIKTASLLKAGVQVASRAVMRTNGREEETQATVGLPPQPVVPPESGPSAPIGDAGAPDTPEALPDAPWAVPAPPLRPER